MAFVEMVYSQDIDDRFGLLSLRLKILKADFMAVKYKHNSLYLRLGEKLRDMCCAMPLMLPYQKRARVSAAVRRVVSTEKEI